MAADEGRRSPESQGNAQWIELRRWAMHKQINLLRRHLNREIIKGRRQSGIEAVMRCDGWQILDSGHPGRQGIPQIATAFRDTGRDLRWNREQTDQDGIRSFRLQNGNR
jgi:hypothetical protein